MGFLRRERPDEGVATVPAIVVDYGFGRESGVELPEGGASRHVEAQVRRLDGDGRVEAVAGRLQGHAWWLMEEGDTIPVRVDEAGRVVGFDRAAVEALYAERTDELKVARKRFSSLRHLYRQDVGVERSQLSAARDILREAAGAPRKIWGDIRATDAAPLPQGDPCPPVEGVDFTTFVAVQAALVRDRVGKADHEAVATAMGVPPGRWAVASDAWMRRVRSDPTVAQAFGAAYQRALKGR
jgi:hypothetical protein